MTSEVPVSLVSKLVAYFNNNPTSAVATAILVALLNIQSIVFLVPMSQRTETINASEFDMYGFTDLLPKGIHRLKSL